MHAYAGNEKSETDSISLTRTVDKKLNTNCMPSRMFNTYESLKYV